MAVTSREPPRRVRADRDGGCRVPEGHLLISISYPGPSFWKDATQSDVNKTFRDNADVR